jgi:hypothetical protein
MKKIITSSISIVLFLLILFITILLTIGIETNKFNEFISKKVSQAKNIDLDLDTIKFKIDIKELSLFLEAKNPKITYREVYIPAKNAKVYINFVSLIKSDVKLKKLNLNLKELDITQLNKLSSIIKPSNFKSILNNKIKKGKLISEIEIFLKEDGTIKDFIAKGTVKNLEAELFSNIHLRKINLGFFADQNDILIKNIFGYLDDIKISDGDIKLNLENGAEISSNFNSKIDLDEKIILKYSEIFKKFELFKNLKSLKADLSNNISLNLDSTYKIKDYSYNILGTIKKGKFELLKPFKNDYIRDELKTVYLSELKIKTTIIPKNISLNGEGKYSFNNLDFSKIDFKNKFNKDYLRSKLNLNYRNSFTLDLINYKKPKTSIATLYLDLEINSDNINIYELSFKEGKNAIKINGLELKKNQLLSFKKIGVETTNNEFTVQKQKIITIRGNKFDATNLVKFLNKQVDENKFQQINNNIEIDFKKIKAPTSEMLQNFRLIGEIQKGKFVKISSKGDFGGNNFLDISMKKDKSSNKKYLEVYSDLTRPLLTEYSFFNGLSGGKLFFTSIIDGSKSNSKLKIEKFKVVNAPGMIKLLSLADLGGLADLAEGEGLSFDTLEIDMEKDKNFLKLNEILALGPSMSILVDGYQENNLTSLRGTLVPAKTLNKLISKIPVIGQIVIPKEVGEGLFGISFKMKGPKDNIKTTINPIKTLTPRFIQKIVERNKVPK